MLALSRRCPICDVYGEVQDCRRAHYQISLCNLDTGGDVYMGAWSEITDPESDTTDI